MSLATDAGPRRLLALTVAVVAAAGAIGLLGAVTSHDDLPQPGDLWVTARDFTFQPAAVDSEAGDINLFVDNADATLHDFTIDNVVAVDIPGRRSRRAGLTLDPGTYPFYCSLHPAMTGTLIVQ